MPGDQVRDIGGTAVAAQNNGTVPLPPGRTYQGNPTSKRSDQPGYLPPTDDGGDGAQPPFDPMGNPAAALTGGPPLPPVVPPGMASHPDNPQVKFSQDAAMLEEQGIKLTQVRPQAIKHYQARIEEAAKGLDATFQTIVSNPALDESIQRASERERINEEQYAIIRARLAEPPPLQDTYIDPSVAESASALAGLIFGGDPSQVMNATANLANNRQQKEFTNRMSAFQSSRENNMLDYNRNANQAQSIEALQNALTQQKIGLGQYNIERKDKYAADKYNIQADLAKTQYGDAAQVEAEKRNYGYGLLSLQNQAKLDVSKANLMQANQAEATKKAQIFASELDLSLQAAVNARTPEDVSFVSQKLSQMLQYENDPVKIKALANVLNVFANKNKIADDQWQQTFDQSVDEAKKAYEINKQNAETSRYSAENRVGDGTGTVSPGITSKPGKLLSQDEYNAAVSAGDNPGLPNLSSGAQTDYRALTKGLSDFDALTAKRQEYKDKKARGESIPMEEIIKGKKSWDDLISPIQAQMDKLRSGEIATRRNLLKSDPQFAQWLQMQRDRVANAIKIWDAPAGPARDHGIKDLKKRFRDLTGFQYDE
jgi:hypothetical protein